MGEETRAHEEKKKKQEHVLLLSFPIPSHLNPLLQLARKLCSSSSSFLFTSIVSLHTASRSPAPPSIIHGASSILTIPVPDGLPPSHPRSDFFDQLQACLGMRSPVEHLLADHRLHPPISCIISDVFVPWSRDVASQFDLPLFAFFTSNATACCVMSSCPQLLSQGFLPFKAKVDPNQRITCPGAPPLLPSEFPPSMQAEDLTFYRFQFTLKLFDWLNGAAGLVLNSCFELEPKAVSTLRTKCPVYTVGPLLLPSGDGDESPSIEQAGLGFWQVEDRCLPWLDTQAASSVLYVSFGSLSTFSDSEQIKELALGLEASQQPFLWVIRQDAVDGSLSEVLPEDFLEHTKDRSLIISWAPQLDVLKHPAVGGFLSHCGWNSVLENIALGGIPMLCWPDIAEQKVNTRLLVDDWKMGLEFETRGDGKVDRLEVERAVRALMEGQEGKERRKRAAELKSDAGKVVKQGGSSFRNLEAFVKNMRERAHV